MAIDFLPGLEAIKSLNNQNKLCLCLCMSK